MHESNNEKAFEANKKDNVNHDIESDDHVLERDVEFSEYTSKENKELVADLRAKLKKSEDEKGEYLTGWQRAKADFINARKQDIEANKLLIKFAEANLVSEIIPVLVSFDIAFANTEAADDPSGDWKKGVEQIRNKLLAVLLEHNVEVIDPLGKQFDPSLAEAVGMMDTKNPNEDHVVLSVFQKGYKLHEKVISPAKVRVGRYSETA